MLKQVITTENIVKIGNENELRFNLIKSVYARALSKNIEIERKMIINAMELAPMFEIFVSKYEIRSGKDREDFSILERDALINAFKNRYIDRLGGTNEKIKKAK